MKRNLWAPLCISAAILLSACGGGEEKKTETAKTDDVQTVQTDDSMVKSVEGKGKELMEKQDCKTCHAADTKIIGPSYKDIAEKYDSTSENIGKLAEKVIKGGSGNWGEVPMAPHTGIAQDDAKEMVKYIISEGNKKKKEAKK